MRSVRRCSEDDNGGRIEDAQRMAGHSNAKTTGLYDRRNDDISVGKSKGFSNTTADVPGIGRRCLNPDKWRRVATAANHQ